eukprot:CFRG7020T1
MNCLARFRICANQSLLGNLSLMGAPSGRQWKIRCLSAAAQRTEKSVEPLKEAKRSHSEPSDVKTPSNKKNQKVKTKKILKSKVRVQRLGPTRVDVTCVTVQDLVASRTDDVSYTGREPPTSSLTLLEYFSERARISQADVILAAKVGGVWVNSKQIRNVKSCKLKNDDVAYMYYDRSVAHSHGPPPGAVMLADKGPGKYSVWYKPPGMQGMSTKVGDIHTLQRLIQRKLPKRDVRFVNPLDFNIGGLTVVSHTKIAQQKFAEIQEGGRFKARYIARVHGQMNPTSGNVTSKSRTISKTSTSESTAKQKRSGKLTIPKVVTYFTNATYIPSQNMSVVTLKYDETMKKDQFANHMASIGHPIVGDQRNLSIIADEDPQPSDLNVTKESDAASNSTTIVGHNSTSLKQKENHIGVLDLNLAELRFYCPFQNRTSVFTMPK